MSLLSESNETDRQLEEYVWKNILLQNISKEHLSKLKTIPAELKKRKFQVFEVLVAEVLFMLDNQINWRVTAVQGDSGVDFEGMLESKEIPNWFILPSQIIFGQVKRRSKTLQVGEIRDDLHKIYNLSTQRNQSVLWAVIYIISTTEFGKNVIRADKLLFEPSVKALFGPNPPIIFLDGDKILALWSLKSKSLLSILENYFPPAALFSLENYLAKFSFQAAKSFEFGLSGAAEGITGIAITRHLSVSSSLGVPSTLTLRIKWVPNPDEKNIVHVMRPSLLSAPKGIQISFNGKETFSIDLYFRSFALGKIELGIIELLNEEGDLLKTCSLGTANFHYQFIPPFFSKPYRQLLQGAESNILESLGGKTTVLAVTGVGGAGKSRVCDEIADMASRYGYETLSVAHANNKTSKRKIIRDIFFQLVNSDNEDFSIINEIVNALRNKLKGFDPSWDQILIDYFQNPAALPHSETVVKSLFGLFFLQTEKSPVLIHLRDMHWCDKEDFLVLKQLIYNIDANQKYFSKGIIFVFEGRNKEALKIDDDYYSPIDWFEFLKTDFVIEKTVGSWNSADSKEFLTEIFFQSIDRNRFINVNEMPMYSEMIENILFWANGNPMHLIEQLKLLQSMEIIGQADNGLLYVRRRLPSDYAVPQKTKELISYRIEFFRQLHPVCIDLLSFFAKIEKRIHSSFYNFISQQLAEISAYKFTETIREMGFVTLPDNINPFLEFSHENYYQVFLKENISSDNKLPRTALKWYNKLPGATVTKKQILEQVIIYFLLDNTDYKKITKLISSGLDTYREDNLDEKFLKRLLNVPENFLSGTKYRRYNIYFELAEILIRIGSWENALSLLEEIKKMRQVCMNESDYVQTLLKAKGEIANIRTDLQQTDVAVKEVDEALQLIDHLEKKDFSEEYIFCKEDLWDKKCVALWFNGQISEAIKWEFNGYLTSRKRNDIGFSTVLRQMGTLFLHRDPDFGISLLEQALELIQSFPEAHYQLVQIIEVQLLMGYLLKQCNKPNQYNIIHLIALKEKAVFKFNDCMERKSIYVASVCGLVCGSASALLKDYSEAEYWFKMTIATATAASLHDVLWKARINLAQVYFTKNEHQHRVLIDINIQEAYTIITDALNKLTPSYRASRLRLMRLSLLHIRRLGYRRPEMGNMTDFENWEDRPYYISKANCDQQVLHVRDIDNDYFLMN